MTFELLDSYGVPIKMWTKGVPVEAEAKQQLRNIASMPFIFKHLAVMPDVHLGKDADMIDETPQAYKNIDDVMKAQLDLVEVVHTLKQVLCVKG